MKVSVLGLGYVGLPLCLEFAKAGLDVTGIDISEEKVEQLNRGESYVVDVPEQEIKAVLSTGLFRATTDFSVIANSDAACICVPTPLTKTMDPDISYIVSAVEAVATYLHEGMLVVLESTTYPGTTEELVLSILSKTGLKVGEEFYLVFSPERTDPGNKTYSTRNTPKVIGGITPECTKKGIALYQHAVDTLVPVKNPSTAEMVKLLENTFRAINIGLVNELAIMCKHLNVAVWDVIDAAKTKPFGFMAFYPGPGLGGHCIPIDPLYLSWKLKSMNYTARFIELATVINSGMPEHVVTEIGDALNDERKSVKGSKILLLGVAYKGNVDDTRESPAIDIIGLLQRKGAEITYSDNYVPELEVAGRTLHSYDLGRGVSEFDCVVVVTVHDGVDYETILRDACLVYDTRNVTGGLKLPATCRVVRL